MNDTQLDQARHLSPKRNSTEATSIPQLAEEQLQHFGINPKSEYGESLYNAAMHLYQAQLDVNNLWQVTNRTLDTIDRKDKIAYFNAKKFLSFQIAKVLDTLQNPFRATYQSLQQQTGSQVSKSHYPLFDNVTALFSATPLLCAQLHTYTPVLNGLMTRFKVKKQHIRFIPAC